MRNMLIAYATLGLLAVATTATADETSVVQSVTDNVVQTAPADVAAPAVQPTAQPAEVIQTQTEQSQPAMTQQYYVQPQRTHYHYHQPQRRAGPKKQNVFQKLLELERKKNAWLRKTFLGK